MTFERLHHWRWAATHAARSCREPIVSLSMPLALTLTALSGPVRGQQAQSQMDRESTRETVEAVAAAIHREYFDPGVAARVEVSLRQRLEQGRYADAQTPESLADMLTRDLFSATRDKHLAVAVVRDSTTASVSTEATAQDESREARGRRSNFGVQRVEILAGNVGYLNLTAFYRLEEAGDTVAAAMRTLRHADALVLDLRDNGGGSPDTVALLASYLFAAPGLPLFEIVPRSGGGGGRYATEATPLPERDGNRPIYVLTSERTFSAGEGLAFILQERHRAEVVGEKTAGAANPGRPYRVNARFEVTIPNGKVRTAATGRNWEGVGVVPDVNVAAADALRVAHVHALRELLKLAPKGSWHDTLDQQLRTIEEPKWQDLR